MKFRVLTVVLAAALSSSTEAFIARTSHQDGVTQTFLERRSCQTTPTNSRLYMAEEEKAAPSTGAETPQEKVAAVTKSPFDDGSHQELMYCLGVNLARQLGDVRPLVENGDELAAVAKGVLDTLIGRLTEDGQRALLATRGKDLNDIITDRANNIKERLKKTGQDMLDNMEKTDGVEKLETGTLVHVLEAKPDAQRPTIGSSVKVHYHGTLPDGTVFDSTLVGPEQEPVTFALGQVIPGWRDGLMKMKEGETAMLGIPPEQAYGEEGTPDGRIPGSSTLFFKVQLVEILTGAIGGAPSLLGADGKEMKKESGGGGGSGLIGADGKPL